MLAENKTIEAELTRFEAEILKPPSARNLFVPHQLRPIIGANTFSQVQQKLQNQQSFVPNVAVSPSPPTFMPTFVPTNIGKSASIIKTGTTPVVLSSAPKLYQKRQAVNGPMVSTVIDAVPHGDFRLMQYDINQKLKKIKTEKSIPNPIAEEAIKAARASSALQSFQTSDRKKKDRKTVRVAGGSVWEDSSLADWPDDDFRIFCGDLGNDVNDEVLTRTFNKYPSFQRARVVRDKRTGKSKGFGFVSFREPVDFIRAMKEMDGRYVGSRPIKLRKSTWKQRSLDIVKKKEREKQQLLNYFNS